MKRIILPVLSVILLMMAACQKDPVNATTSLSASKSTDIKKGEPVLFTLFNSRASSINWKVSPATVAQAPANAQIDASGSIASIRFGRGGTFIITAESGNRTDSSVVSVTDSTYAPPPAATVLPLSAGEQIIITASKLDSAAYSGLIFYAHTLNSYTCMTNYLMSDFTMGTNSYTIDFTGVSVPAGCTTGTSKAGTFEYFIPMPEGTNSLSIKLGTTTYTGTVVKAGSSYTINWSYTSGVTISPATL